MTPEVTISLPFLQKKPAQTGLIVKTRAPDDQSADSDYDSGDSGIESCAQDLISAIQASDASRVAQALKDAWEILESQPHDEAPAETPEGDQV